MRRIFYADIRDPRINLALEEYCLRNDKIGRELLLFYINDPAVIIGRHQVTCQQVNTAFIHRHQIPVIRRISGGGAVYHDRGNLNFSVITPYGRSRLRQLQTVLQPLIIALARLGIDVHRNARDNLFVGKHKICGTAQYTNTRRLICHGSLLFDVDLAALEAVLKPDLDVRQSRGVQSIPSAVGNIIEFLSQPMDIETFAQHLEREIGKVFGPIKPYRLNAPDWEQIQKLSATKYKTWQWNYGNDPPFKLRHRWDGDGKLFEANLLIQQGIIKAVTLGDDPGPSRHFKALAQELIGRRLEAERLLALQNAP